MFTACAAIALALSSASAQKAATDEVERLRESAAVLAELASTPDNAIPRNVLERAEAIAVFPSVKKAGFVVGGQWGRGVISVRDEKGEGWSAPAFMRLAGGSIGAQIGAQAVDLVLIVMNRRGVENLMKNEIKLGADISATAGPVGREASASTDLQMRAEILSYSRSRGLFAGVTVNGASLAEDREADDRFYGQTISSRNIVAGKAGTVPADAKAFLDALSRNVPKRKVSN
jgi:SH3 domain-containing YSC84-like protein 1